MEKTVRGVVEGIGRRLEVSLVGVGVVGVCVVVCWQRGQSCSMLRQFIHAVAEQESQVERGLSIELQNVQCGFVCGYIC